MDGSHLGDTGTIQAFKGAYPQFQVGVHRILHQHRNVNALQGIGHFLHGERVHGGAGTDPKEIESGVKGSFHMGGIGHLSGYRQTGFLAGADKPLKTRVPEIDIICDPSHISGNRELIGLISQKALDLDMAGLMIESHLNPDAAWSDAKQQVTPANLGKIIDSLVVRSVSSENKMFKDTLSVLREQIDQLDEEIMSRMSTRMKISEKIGQYKRDNNVTILQVGRWEEIIQSRVQLGRAMGLDEGFLRDLLRLVHHESIQIQTQIMNKVEERV